MPTAPLYRRDESVYLRSSAEIGKLEAFKINSIKQIQDGRWVYRIDIYKKPPTQGLIGDSYDSRVSELALFYTEIELITVCEALDIICTRFRDQTVALQIYIILSCSESDAPIVGMDEPRWTIGDTIYFDASARLGFLHDDVVSSIQEVGIQPGSRRTRYCYTLKRLKNKAILFREDELITFCEAADKAVVALERDLNAAEAQRLSLCS